jgi:hypothetical protein
LPKFSNSNLPPSEERSTDGQTDAQVGTTTSPTLATLV